MADSLSSSPLRTLPRECWQHILEYLPMKDIWSLLFVSKACYTSSISSLYRSISFEWRPIPIRRILLLMRAIIRHPERASHIHHVELVSRQKVDSLAPWETPDEPTSQRYKDEDEQEISYFPDVLEQALAIVENNNFPNLDEWTEWLIDGYPNAFVSVFLAQLHNLRSLRLDYSLVWNKGLPGRMLRHALTCSPRGSLSTFRHLAEVDYGGNVRLAEPFEDYPIQPGDGYPICNPDQFSPWFYLPSLKSLKIWLRTTKGSLDVPARVSSLEKLLLCRTTIHEYDVPQLLSLSTKLKTLHLGLAYQWRAERALLYASSITAGLESTLPTLQDLSLGIEYYPSYLTDFNMRDDEKELIYPFHGLFKRFTNLRTLEVPIQMLLGWDTQPWVDLACTLPKTVEKLCLRGDFQPYDENGWHEGEMLVMISNNASRLRESMPNLRIICVRKFRIFWSTLEIDQSRDMARDACMNVGIELKVVADHLSTGLWTDESFCPERVVQ